MPRKIREIRIDGNVAYITLTKGYEAVIDAADVPLVAGHNWGAMVERRRDGSIRAVYAFRRDYAGGKQKMVRMHRVIADTAGGLETDHRDGDGLNNRKSNLRGATVAQNQHNQRIRADNISGVKGVRLHKQTGKWQARIRFGDKRRHLGLFTDLEAAAAAYAKASAELHGEFGRTK